MPATGHRRGGMVYHWKHGYIPLDHYAALQKAHHSKSGAIKVMQKHGIDVPKGYKSDHKPTAKPAAPSHKPSDVSAPGSWTTRQRPDGSFSVHGKDGSEVGRVRLVTTGKHKGKWEGRVDGRHGADHADHPNKTIDAMYDSVHGKSGEAALARSGGSPEERRLAAYKAAIRAHQESVKKPVTNPTADAHAARAAELRAAADKKRAEADRIANGVGAPDRAGAMLRAKDSQRMNARMDSGLRRFTEKQREAKALESKAHLAEGRAKEAARTRLTHEDVKGATHVQDQHGQWREVVRVNAKSVTVKTPYSWTDSIPHDKVRKVLRATPEQIAAAKAKAAKK